MTRPMKYDPRYEYKLLQLELRVDLKARLKAEAVRRRVTMTEVLNLALNIGLAGLEADDLMDAGFKKVAKMARLLEEATKL